MTVINFPSVVPKLANWVYRSNSAAFPSPTSGVIQTVSRPGGSWAVSLSYPPQQGSDGSIMRSFTAAADGMANRFYVVDHTYDGPTGSLSVSELITNADFSNGITGWQSTNANDMTIAAVSGGMRLRRVGAADREVRPTADSTVVVGVSYATTFQYVPEVLLGSAPTVSLRTGTTSGTSTDLVSESRTPPSAERVGLGWTAPLTTARPAIALVGTGAFGDQYAVHKMSISRCLLVDNGFNALTYSEQFDNAAWTKTECTITADAADAADGTTTADKIVESATASVQHWVQQSYSRVSQSEFWTGTIYIESAEQQRIQLAVGAQAANTDSGSAYFDAATGTITSAAATSGSAALAYASMHDCGNGIYRCRVSVKLPATTTAVLTVFVCNGASHTKIYTGDGASGIYVWGADLQRGGQLGRYTETTTAAIAGTDQTGSSVWVKGLDASVNRQMLVGDWMEIIGSGLHQLRADLDGDESGVGLAQIKPPLRNSPADEAAVILHNPSMKAVMTSNENGWSNEPGGFSGFTIEAQEIIE